MAASYGTTYKNDICINLSWDGERDGEYEPYKANEYALGEVELRGIPKLENGKIVYDGDTYESDGTVTRKYNVFDMGNITWTYNSTRKMFSSGIFRNNPVKSGGSAKTALHATTNINSMFNGTSLDKVVCCGQVGSWNGEVLVRDLAYDDPAAFKTAMSGVYLIYERDTSVTEQADPWSNPQEVDDFGTEEFVEFGDRDVHIPVGHSTLYQANLRAKLEMGTMWFARRQDRTNTFL